MNFESMKLRGAGAFAGLCALAALFAGCGDDVTKNNVTNNITGAKTVADLDEAGACDSAATGEIVLNADDGALYVCNGKKWKSVEGAEGGEGERASCSLNSVEVDGVEGVEIVCGNAKDTVLNGQKGDKGGIGQSCVGHAIDQGIEVACGEAFLDTLWNGNAGICGRKMYDTAMSFCDFRDSTVYRKVKIGGQVWMRQNLNFVINDSYGHYCYDNSADSCAKYGRLYTWAAAMDSLTTGCGYNVECAADTGRVQGICPDGWRLPDTADWNALFAAVGEDLDTAGTALKNSSGFAALPSGYRSTGGNFYFAGDDAYFWSSSESYEYGAYYLHLSPGFAYASLVSDEKNRAFAVRCVKD